jgi:ornithine decarboxylase
MKAKFTLSKSKILEQYNKVKEFADIISYSSKTNPLVTKILENNTDSMFSIHLINELENVQDKSKVLFLAQAWNKELITKLYENKVRWFAVDNESDLNIIEEWLTQNEVKINLLLRLKLRENTLRTEKFFVFGMNSKIINERIQKINKEKIINLGVHFHRKTQNMSEWNYTYEMQQILEPETLQSISIINMGGGLPSEYANTNINVLQSIFKKITEFRNWLETKNIKLVIEPGRFIAAPAGKLHTTITAIYDNNIIVNASVYNSDMDALIVPVKLLIESELKKGIPYVIKGITPCSLDLFRYRVYLDNPQVNQQLTFLNAGAYNFTTDFCNLDTIETEVIE